MPVAVGIHCNHFVIASAEECYWLHSRFQILYLNAVFSLQADELDVMFATFYGNLLEIHVDTINTTLECRCNQLIYKILSVYGGDAESEDGGQSGIPCNLLYSRYSFHRSYRIY